LPIAVATTWKYLHDLGHADLHGLLASRHIRNYTDVGKRIFAETNLSDGKFVLTKVEGVFSLRGWPGFYSGNVGFVIFRIDAVLAMFVDELVAFPGRAKTLAKMKKGSFLKKARPAIRWKD
jgi:hypothetical protein